MLRKRRKAVHYVEVYTIIDANNEYIVKGSYIRKKEDNSIEGPVTMLLEEKTGTADESIKYLVYVVTRKCRIHRGGTD